MNIYSNGIQISLVDIKSWKDEKFLTIGCHMLWIKCYFNSSNKIDSYMITEIKYDFITILSCIIN